MKACKHCGGGFLGLEDFCSPKCERNGTKQSVTSETKYKKETEKTVSETKHLSETENNVCPTCGRKKPGRVKKYGSDAERLAAWRKLKKNEDRHLE